MPTTRTTFASCMPATHPIAIGSSPAAFPYEDIRGEGNVLSFTHRGTHYQVENVLPVDFDARVFSVTLTEVAAIADHRGAGARQKRVPFSIAFHCPSALLNQGLYKLTHENLPACEIFLSPFEGGEGWCKLEAVFN